MWMFVPLILFLSADIAGTFYLGLTMSEIIAGISLLFLLLDRGIRRCWLKKKQGNTIIQDYVLNHRFPRKNEYGLKYIIFSTTFSKLFLLLNFGAFFTLFAYSFFASASFMNSAGQNLLNNFSLIPMIWICADATNQPGWFDMRGIANALLKRYVIQIQLGIRGGSSSRSHAIAGELRQIGRKFAIIRRDMQGNEWMTYVNWNQVTHVTVRILSCRLVLKNSNVAPAPI